MNLREAIEAYVWAWDYYQIDGNGKPDASSIARLAMCGKSLDVVLAVAEAAIAYAEYQASSPGVEAKDYFRERCRLWDAFMAAHKAVKAFEKAKEACKSMAGEGET